MIYFLFLKALFEIHTRTFRWVKLAEEIMQEFISRRTNLRVQECREGVKITIKGASTARCFWKEVRNNQVDPNYLHGWNGYKRKRPLKTFCINCSPEIPQYIDFKSGSHSSDKHGSSGGFQNSK